MWNWANGNSFGIGEVVGGPAAMAPPEWNTEPMEFKFMRFMQQHPMNQ